MIGVFISSGEWILKICVWRVLSDETAYCLSERRLVRMSLCHRAGRSAILAAPRAGPSRLSWTPEKSLRRALSLWNTQGYKSEQPQCTCNGTSSIHIAPFKSTTHRPITLQRTFATSSRFAYPAAAGATDAAESSEKALPTLTEEDQQRLYKLRNIGISAHIDR